MRGSRSAVGVGRRAIRNRSIPLYPVVTGHSVWLRPGSVRARPILPRICRGASISSVAGRLRESDSEVLSKGQGA